MNKVMLITVFAASMSVPGRAQKFVSRIDQFDATQIVSETGLQTAKVKGMKDSSGFVTALSVFVAATRSRDGKVTYGAHFWLADNHWIFVNEGQSLTVRIDGEPRSYSTAGFPKRNTEGGELISESITYLVTRKDLEDISRAHDVTFKLQGDNGIIIRAFRPKAIDGIKEFVARTQAFDAGLTQK